MGFLKGLKKVLTVLTDILTIGRSKGWWEKGKGPDIKGPSDNPPRSN